MNAPLAEPLTPAVGSSRVVSTLPTPADSTDALRWLAELRQWFDVDFTLLCAAENGGVDIVAGPRRMIAADTLQAAGRAAVKRRVELLHPEAATSQLVVPLGDLG